MSKVSLQMSALAVHKRTAVVFSLSLLAVILAVGIAYAFAILLNPRATISSFLPPSTAKLGKDVRPKYAFSIYGNKDRPLIKPLSVVEGVNGDIYVADGGGGVVQVFDYQGRHKRTIGQRAVDVPEPGQLRYPIGVAVSESGRLFVSDSQGGHISVFEDGKFVRYFGEKEGKKEFSIPAGLLYRNGDLYVNDIGYHQVLVFASNGEVRKELGLGRGSERGEMEFPNFSWVDADGDVFVSDSNNNRVQVFSLDGTLVNTIWQAAGSKLALPRGVGVDASGQIHVVSAFGHRVEVFDKAGNWRFSYGRQGEGDGELSFPNGLYVTSTRVYIADRENRRVQVWEY